MSREQALSNLQEMKETIEELFYETERANSLSDQLEAMKYEYDNPKPFKFKGKDENTAEPLKKSFLEANVKKICNNRIFERIWIILWMLVLVAFSAYLFLPAFGTETYTTQEFMMACAEDSSGVVSSLLGHIILGLLATIPAIINYWKHNDETYNFLIQYLGIIIAFRFVLNAIMAFLIYAWIVVFSALGHLNFLYGYLIIAVGMRFPLFVSHIIKKIRMKKPSLTPSQKAEVKAAQAVDEQTKLDNIEAEKAARTQYEAKIEARKKQIIEDYDPTIEELNEAKENAEDLLEKLDSLDYLSEEEKTIPIIEILINLIKTRRADDIKEALHEYDKIKVNEQLLAIENEKLAVMRKKAEQEREDRQKHYEQQLYEARRANDLAWEANQEAKRANERMLAEQSWHNQAMQKAAKADANELRHISNTLYDIKYYNNLDSLMNR